MTQFLTLTGAPGDAGAGAEARTIFEALDAAAPSFSELARLRIFYTDRADFGPLHAVRQPYFNERLPQGDFPATTGIITGGRRGAPPVLEMEATLGAGKGVHFAPDVWRAIQGSTDPLPFSHATSYEGVLFVSGQVSYSLAADLVGTTLVAQLDHALSNFEAIVAEAGSAMRDVASFTVYVVERAFDAMAPAVARFEERLAAYGSATSPVVVWVGVQELFQPGLLIEIEGVVAHGTAVRSARAESLVAGAPRAAAAARAGSWAMATGTSTCSTPDAAAVAVGSAWAMVEDGLRRIGLTGGAIDRVTAWCAADAARDAVEAELARQAPGCAIVVVPLVILPGDEGRLILEAIGHMPPTAPAGPANSSNQPI